MTTYMEEGQKINDYLVTNRIEAISKGEIRALFQIHHNNASAVFGALKQLGWNVSRNEVRV